MIPLDKALYDAIKTVRKCRHQKYCALCTEISHELQTWIQTNVEKKAGIVNSLQNVFRIANLLLNMNNSLYHRRASRGSSFLKIPFTAVPYNWYLNWIRQDKKPSLSQITNIVLPTWGQTTLPPFPGPSDQCQCCQHFESFQCSIQVLQNRTK